MRLIFGKRYRIGLRDAFIVRLDVGKQAAARRYRYLAWIRLA